MIQTSEEFHDDIRFFSMYIFEQVFKIIYNFLNILGIKETRNNCYVCHYVIKKVKLIIKCIRIVLIFKTDIQNIEINTLHLCFRF